MREIKSVLHNERGYLLLNVVFLTLITAFAAVILLNAAPRVRNPQSTLKLTAIYLANEQFAVLESRAATGEQLGGSYSFLGDEKDLKSENFSAGEPTTFEVETNVSGGVAKVVVKWQVNGKDFKVEAERKIAVAK